MPPERVDAGGLPRVDYFAFGGTISSIAREHGRGVEPLLTAEEILASVPEIGLVADVVPHQVARVGSGELTVAILADLHRQIRAAVDAGSRGIVITQGTDTIEETSFILDLLWDGEVPIAYTGAMRHPRMPGSDGAANLLAAVTTVLDSAARGLGVLVVLNDEIHAARLVHKTHTSSPRAFSSRPFGPIGSLAEGRPVIALRPASRPVIPVPEDAVHSPVALVRVGVGDDLRLLGAAADLGYRGVVLEGLGGGHVTAASLETVAQTARELPVVLASRTGAGEVLTSTYLFPGCESQLLEMGLVRAGALDGIKARALLTVCLAAGMDRGGIAEAFRAVGLTTGPTLVEEPVAC
jgi:L-asparaginase